MDMMSLLETQAKHLVVHSMPSISRGFLSTSKKPGEEGLVRLKTEGCNIQVNFLCTVYIKKAGVGRGLRRTGYILCMCITNVEVLNTVIYQFDILDCIPFYMLLKLSLL